MKKIGIIVLVMIILLLCVACGERGYQVGETQEVTGTEITLEQLTLQIEGMEERQEVKPSDPIGYYNYYEPHEGYYYHVVYGTLKNTGKEQTYIHTLKVEAVGKENEVNQGKLVLCNPVNSDFWEDLAPNEELGFYLFSLVKEGEEPPKAYHLYYNEDLKEGTKEDTFDYCLKYILE